MKPTHALPKPTLPLQQWFARRSRIRRTIAWSALALSAAMIVGVYAIQPTILQGTRSTVHLQSIASDGTITLRHEDGTQSVARLVGLQWNLDSTDAHKQLVDELNEKPIVVRIQYGQIDENDSRWPVHLYTEDGVFLNEQWLADGIVSPDYAPGYRLNDWFAKSDPSQR